MLKEERAYGVSLVAYDPTWKVGVCATNYKPCALVLNEIRFTNAEHPVS